MIQILLADDDNEDCLFFKEALEELQIETSLTAVQDGEQLMQLLIKEVNNLPHVIFLDLNMPRKNGFECLEAIKSDPQLNALPVVVISTSFNPNEAALLYQKGAQHYICKPDNFLKLKEAIGEALTSIINGSDLQPTKEKFLLGNLKTTLF